jgi:hypothetical protein
MRRVAEHQGGNDMETRFMSKQNMAGDVGDSKKKGFFEKVKEHKKEIAIGAVIVISAVLVGKNKGAFQSAIKSSRMEEALTNSLETQNNVGTLISEAISTSVPSNLPIDSINVRGHVRNLAEGCKPSISKIESAANYGYSLKENQTWVIPYTKVAA